MLKFLPRGREAAICNVWFAKALGGGARPHSRKGGGREPRHGRGGARGGGARAQSRKGGAREPRHGREHRHGRGGARSGGARAHSRKGGAREPRHGREHRHGRRKPRHGNLTQRDHDDVPTHTAWARKARAEPRQRAGGNASHDTRERAHGRTHGGHAQRSHPSRTDGARSGGRGEGARTHEGGARAWQRARPYPTRPRSDGRPSPRYFTLVN